MFNNKPKSVHCQGCSCKDFPTTTREVNRPVAYNPTKVTGAARSCGTPGLIGQAGPAFPQPLCSDDGSLLRLSRLTFLFPGSASANPDFHKVFSVGTFENHFIGAPPRILSPELHDVEVGENIVVEKAAKAACV